MAKHQSAGSTGGARKKLRQEEPEGRPAAWSAPPSLVTWLQIVWSKREHFNNVEREAIHAFLQRVQRGPLSPAQLDWAKKIARSVGIGFDDPPEPGPALSREHQPWGPLPMKPPRRRSEEPST